MIRKKSSYYRCLLALGACLAVSASAHAQGDAIDEPTEDSPDDYRDDARRLATEAAQQYEAGEYELALDLFLRAGKLYDAPTLKFWQARCLEQMGRLVDAEARYAEVARTKIDSETPEAFVSAQRDSEVALAQLRKRLPTITIVINHAKDISKVELDGRVLPPPLVGAPVAVDPGTHVVTVTRSSGTARTESVAIVESQAQEVHVNFDTPTQTPLVPLMTGTTDEETSPESNWRTTLGFSSLVVGSVGVGVGVFAGVQAMDRHHTLDENCPDGRCGPSYHEDLDSFRSWRTISTVGYAVGILGLGAGAVLLLTGGSEEKTALRLYPQGASLERTF